MGIGRPDQMAMDHEQSVAATEERHQPLTADEEEILFKKVLPAERNKPTINDPKFAEIYGHEQIEADQAWLDEITVNDRQEPKTTRARILEYIIEHHAEMSDWLAGSSGECYAVETTDYDDIANHVDFVVEWKINGKIFRLAVDITTSSHDSVIERKENLIKREIEEGRLAKIKYFESEADPKTVGSIEGIPRAVIAIPGEGIKKLCGDLVNKKPKDLAKNPEQLLILEEISQQMSDQIEYSLGLLLEEIERTFQHLDNEEKRELKSVLKQAISLADNPDNLSKVLETLDEQKKLLNKLESYPVITKYLKVIDKQRKIKNIVDQIITEKEKGGEVQAPAAELLEKNIVLRRVNSRLARFEVPPHLEDLLEAA